jgi:hypothetical protein
MAWTWKICGYAHGMPRKQSCPVESRTATASSGSAGKASSSVSAHMPFQPQVEYAEFPIWPTPGRLKSGGSDIRFTFAAAFDTLGFVSEDHDREERTLSVWQREKIQGMLPEQA